MKFDWNMPFKTKDGLPARLLGVVKSVTRLTHMVAVDRGREECVNSYTSDGAFWADGSTCPSDLVNVKTGYINVYHVGQNSYYYTTLEDALDARGGCGADGMTFEITEDGSSRLVK